MRVEAEICFFTDCHKKANERGKFCEEHDKKEREAAVEVSAIFEKRRKYENK